MKQMITLLAGALAMASVSYSQTTRIRRDTVPQDTMRKDTMMNRGRMKKPMQKPSRQRMDTITNRKDTM